MIPLLSAGFVGKVYVGMAARHAVKPMEARLRRTSLFALYQTSIVLGIALLPVALLARQVGVRLPVGELIDRLGSAYEATAEE